jgi:quercetin dioxygenase-like cupin family protein
MTNATSDPDPVPVTPVVLGSGEGRQIPPEGEAFVTIKVERRHSGGTLTAYEAALAPRRAGPVVHRHRSWDEAFYVLAGEMTFLVGDATRTLPAGSFVFVPHGVLHTYWNASPEPARLLIVFTPSGIEDFFYALMPVLAASGEETIGAITTLAEQYDMIVPPTERQPFAPLG